MTWWAWLTIFGLLVLASLVLAFLALRSLWRKAMALGGDLGTISEQLARLSDELARQRPVAPAGADGPEPPAVFADPAELRRRRYLNRSRTKR